MAASAKSTFKIELERWPLSDGKGLDDLLAAGKSPELVTGNKVATAIAEIVKAAGPLPMASLARGTSTSSKSGNKDDKQSPAQRIVGLALATGIFLFHTPGRSSRAYASVSVGKRTSTYAVKSEDLKRWLRKIYIDVEKRPPSSGALDDAIGVLDAKAIDAKAILDGPEENVALRIAGTQAGYVFDLANPKGEAVEITATGWQIALPTTVRFVQKPAMEAVPTPITGGSLTAQRTMLNLSDNVSFLYVVLWLLAALRPVGPYPILIVSGEQGSGKSVTSRMLRALGDPNYCLLRSQPRDERDLMVAAENAHVLGFDNISVVKPWLSDAFCRLATGGGFSTRKLYSDDTETIFSAKRPILLNGIGDIVDRADLLDRALFVTLPVIPESRRQTEEDFWSKFEQLRPEILGALFDAMSVGLKNLPQLKYKCHVALPKCHASEFAPRVSHVSCRRTKKGLTSIDVSPLIVVPKRGLEPPRG